MHRRKAAAINHDHTAQSHAQHLNPWALGAVGAASSVMLAPYVLPWFNVWNFDTTIDLMGQISGSSHAAHLAGAASASGTGWAAGISGAIGHIPLVGPLLAGNAIAGLVATGVIGIGGILLANWMEKHEHGGFPWSRVVRYTALATSALIALPGILSGLSVGIAFLTMAIAGPLAANTAIELMKATLGATAMSGGTSMGSGILAMTVPHLLTCGAAVVPLISGLFLGKKTAPGDDAIMELVSTTPQVPGQPTQLAFRLTDSKGKTLGPDALSTTFTEKLHTMVVDESLIDYHHLHPVYDAASGLFTCSFTPRLNASYMAWHDYTREGAAEATHQRTDLRVSSAYNIPASIQQTSSATVGDLTIYLTAEPPLRAGRESMLRVQVRDASGQPVNALEPIMGAYGHLAGFSADGQHFIHSHPMEPLTQPMQGGQLTFHVKPDQPGMSKFFLQLQHAGHTVTLPFGQAVQAPTRFAERATSHAGHRQMAMG